MSDCLFCKIGAGKIPAKLAHEDSECVACHDIAPQAPTHVLIIPKKHVTSLNEVDDEKLVGHLFVVAAKLARELGVAQTGYRVVANTGKDGGQTVAHLHVHLLGGRAMTWPPG
jgi:histidine triad (HIT) family protein